MASNSQSGYMMSLRESFRMALHSLRGNRLRTLLTSLGIVIGVAAVIILVALGDGVQAGLDAQFSRLANQINISRADGSVPSGGVARQLTDEDVAALRNRALAPDIVSVTPSTSGSAALTAGQAQERASVLGATLDYLDVSARGMAAGQWFTDAQERGNAKVVVLGQQAIGLLWGPTVNLDKVIGSEIRVNRTTFRVIGVLVPDGQQDNLAIVPLGASRTYLLGNGDEVDQIIVKSVDAGSVNQASTELTDILDHQHHITSPTNRDFNVHVFQSLLDQRNQFIGFLTVFTAAIAAISLVVGGIGVANIMLVSVTERTREIGIRKAVGARNTAILKQFLIEAVLVTGFGGLIGVVLGVGAAIGGGTIMPMFIPSFPVPIVTIRPVVIAFAVSLLIGVIAGGYPANRAARLHPIQALRYE